jgi:hypothetical protein
MNFNFKNYEPNWQEYDAIKIQLQRLFSMANNEKIIDLKGVFSQDGWEPDWPIVILLESTSISFHTKCNYLWAIGEFQKVEFHCEKRELPLRLKFDTVTNDFNFSKLLYQKLTACFQAKTHVYGDEQAFLLQIGKFYLKIYNAGDELGLKLITLFDKTHWVKLT